MTGLDGTTSGDLLSVGDLSLALKTLHGAEILVDRLSVTVGTGRITCLVGPSGSGKSLLLRAIAGLEPDNTKIGGTIQLGGEEIGHLSRRRRRGLLGRRVSLVHQDPFSSFNPQRTIGSHLTETIRSGQDPVSARDVAVSLIREFGLDVDMLAAYPHQLSGGQLQRFALAAALTPSPQLLLADEVTTALDTVAQRECLDHLATLAKNGLGVLLVTHDRSVAQRWGETTIELAPAAGPQPALVTPPVSEGPPTVHPVRVATDSVSVGYGETSVLEDIDLSIDPGEKIAVVGRSGVGKSTLVRLLGGHLEPHRGSVWWNDTDIYETTPEQLRPLRRYVQSIYQHPLPTFDPRHTVERIVGEPLVCFGLPDDHQQRIESLLEEVGLPAAMTARRPATMSGGEQQRVAIARALAPEPSVLLCDEPVSSLDASLRTGFIALIHRLAESRGMSVVFVTHDISLVPIVADRVVVLAGDRIVDDRPTSKLAHSTVPATAELLAAAPDYVRVGA